MALGTQLLDIPFSGGVSSKLDPVIVGKEKLLTLNNATFNKTGTLQRRDPWNILGGTGTINPVELCTLGNELLAVDSLTNNLYAYSPSAAALTSRGAVPHFSLAVDAVSNQSANIRGLDCAVNGNYTATAWIQGGSTGTVGITILDEVGGTTIVYSKQLYSGALDSSGGAKICAVGSSFIVVFATSTTTLTMVTVTASSGAITTAATNIATDATTGLLSHVYFDAIPWGANQALLVYRSSKASTTVGAMVLNAAGVSVAEITAIGSPITASLCSLTCVAIDANNAWVIAGDSGAGNVWGATVNLSGSTLSVTHSAFGFVGPSLFGNTVAAIKNPTTGYCDVICMPIGNTLTPPWSAYWGIFSITQANTVGSSTTAPGERLYVTSSNAGVSSFILTPTLAGKPFLVNNKTYFPVTVQGVLQTYLLVLDTGNNVVASALYGNGYFDSAAYLEQASCPVNVNGDICIPAIRQGQFSTTNGAKTTQQAVVRVRLTSGRGAKTWHAQAAGSVYFSGSYLAMYDGQQVAEAGFFYFPEGVSAQTSGSGSVSGTFQVCAVYEWMDNQGRRHQSAPSIPVSVTLSSATGILMTSPVLMHGIRSAGCTVVFYRTTNQGLTFYRVNSPTSPLGNNTNNNPTMTYTDTTVTSAASSDTITGNEPLYTTGGALVNDLPPACNAICAWQGRLMFSNAEDRQEWRVSQYPQAGQGLQFNEALLMGRTNQDAGDISALGVMDDKCVVFTPTNAFWVAGSGGNAAGIGATFTSPQLLTNDTGCIDQRSLAVLPDLTNLDGVALSSQGGLAYQSKHGYYLLTRSLTENYVGEGLDAILSGGVAVTSAVVLQDKHQLRLTYGSGGVVVFDYQMGQWAAFSSAAAGYSAACGVIWNGLWTFGATGRFIAQDSVGLSGGDAAASPIVVSLTTPHYRLGSLQGFQRVRWATLFGSYGSPSTISIAAKVNYDSVQWPGQVSGILGVMQSTVYPVSVQSASMVTNDNQRWQFRWHQQIQKCESIQFVITDTPTGGNYSGVGFSGLTLELGVKRGGFKLPAARST
jgi:hypothetical protein